MEAAAKCVELQAKLIKERDEKSAKGPTFGEAADVYIAHLETELKPRVTARGGDYRFPFSRYDDILKKIGTTYICDLTPGKIEQIAAEMMPETTPQARRRQIGTAISATINHYAELDLCAPIRMKRLKKRKSAPKTFVTQTWLDKFVATANELAAKELTFEVGERWGFGAIAPELRAKLLKHTGVAAQWMFYTGSRRGEVCWLKTHNFNLVKRTAFLDGEFLKINDRGEYVLPLELITALRSIWPEGPGDGKLFAFKNVKQFARFWDIVNKAAGIEMVPPHQAGRHSFGTNLGARVGKDLDVATAAELGRWKDKGVFLDTYVHSVNDKQAVVDDIFARPNGGLKAIKGGKE